MALANLGTPGFPIRGRDHQHVWRHCVRPQRLFGSRVGLAHATEYNPEMLVLARRSRQLSQIQLAELSGVTRSAISRYEAGVQPVTENVIDRIASALDYPTSFFRRASPLIGLQGGAVFHRKQQQLPIKKLYRAHALAEIRRMEVMKMMDALELEFPVVPEYPVDLFEDDPQKIARTVRAVMKIPPGPVFNVTKTLEQNGCIVVAHDFESRQIDGFSQQSAGRWCFLHLNIEMPPDRWRWTLAHELGHAVMHFDPMAPAKLVEYQANLFAAEFLTPAHEIGPSLDGLTFQKLGGLKRKWKVSMQALITRAYQLGTISARQRTSMYTRLSRAGYRTREPETLDPPVEEPMLMADLAQALLDAGDYSPDEFRDLVSIGETDFRRYYVDSDDIVKALGIDEIFQDSQEEL